MYHGYDGILLNQVKSSILCLMLNFRCYRKEKKVDPFTPFFCFSLEQGVIFRAWALKRVSIFAFFILKQGQGLRTFAAHPYPKIMAVPPGVVPKSLSESLPTPRVVASSRRLLSRRAVQKNDERACLSFFYLPFFSLHSYLLTDHEEAKRARS